jgi:hypothetical protein
VRDLLAGEFELQVHTGNNRDKDNHGDPPANQQQRPDGEDDGDQLREDRGNPVQNSGIGIGEPLGSVVEVHRLLVVVPPEFQCEEALVHQIAHNRPHLEAHELLDVAVHAAESAPEKTEGSGDDDIDDRLLACRRVAGICGGQSGGGQSCEVRGDERQRRGNQ